MTETIHVICAVCKTEQWDEPIYRDPALANDPGYEAFMQRIDHYLETCKAICPSCQRRLAEQKRRNAVERLLTEGMKTAIHLGCIWGDTTQCNFGLSDPMKESVNAGAWREARELAFDERFTRHRSVMLTGAVGLGKTFMGRCMLNAVGEDRGYEQVCEMTARQYIHAVIGNDPRVWRAQRGFFLLFDDIDKVAWSPGTLQILWELFDMRTHGQFTAITANLDERGLMDMLRDACPKNSSLAEATMERLNPCLHLAIEGEVSFRRTTATAITAVAEPEEELF